jgi:hypothetical protein
MIDGTYSSVRLNGLGPSLGQSYTFKVLTMPGGKAGAIKDVLDKTC